MLGAQRANAVCELDIARKLNMNSDAELEPFYNQLNELLAMLTVMSRFKKK